MSKTRICIVAGDPSADRHGAALIAALRTRRSDLTISAMGGVHLQKNADRFLFPLVGVGGFGFWEPFMKLPQLWNAWRTLKAHLQTAKPDLVIPMDYYGFNIRVATLAKSMGIPVIYYISPQVWASRPGRIQKLASVISKMLVIFPFEETLYQKANVPVRFVGHPLLEQLPAPSQESPEPRVGLLPGSRRSVAARHLPLLIEAAILLHRDFPKARFTLFRPQEIEESFYTPFLADCPWIQLSTDSDYAIRKILWLAIGVSGTASLENALLGIPMIIMYRLSALTYWIAKRLVRVPYIGIPNILAGKALVPELIQEAATPERLVQAATPLLQDASKRRALREALLTLRRSLEPVGNASAADEILRALP